MCKRVLAKIDHRFFALMVILWLKEVEGKSQKGARKGSADASRSYSLSRCGDTSGKERR